MSQNKIVPLKALNDNYIWIIHGKANHIISLDPGEAEPVLDYIQKHNLILDGILLTHHHWDHTGGVAELLNHYPTISVYSSFTDKIKGVTHCVKEGDIIAFPNLKASIQVLEIPGHTLGHLAFIYQNAIFTGDTLFSVGAGKIFEGTPKQMHESLNKLKQLPVDTLIYCGHEYTLANIAFAEVVEPDNEALKQRKKEVENLIEQNLPTLPISLKTELQTNPFLRCNTQAVVNAIENQAQIPLNDPIAILAALREWKNNFKP